jgi:FKBP-type peptidyl-prolyl cis-trans isomerase (trigger factor)
LLTRHSLRVKNRRELNASLNGATLGEADADVDDTLKWLKRSKKKEKELAKKRQQELESMDKQFQDEYTESMSFESPPSRAQLTERSQRT